jgi:hypothetical protein
MIRDRRTYDARADDNHVKPVTFMLLRHWDFPRSTIDLRQPYMNAVSERTSSNDHILIINFIH